MSFDQDLVIVIRGVNHSSLLRKNEENFFRGQDDSFFERRGLKKSDSLEEIRTIIYKMDRLSEILKKLIDMDGITFDEYEQLQESEEASIIKLIQNRRSEILSRISCYSDHAFKEGIEKILKDCKELSKELTKHLLRIKRSMLKSDNEKHKKVCEHFESIILSNLTELGKIFSIFAEVLNEGTITIDKYLLFEEFSPKPLSSDDKVEHKYSNPLEPYQRSQGFMDCLKSSIASKQFPHP